MALLQARRLRDGYRRHRRDHRSLPPRRSTRRGLSRGGHGHVRHRSSRSRRDERLVETRQLWGTAPCLARTCPRGTGGRKARFSNLGERSREGFGELTGAGGPPFRVRVHRGLDGLPKGHGLVRPQIRQRRQRLVGSRKGPPAGQDLIGNRPQRVDVGRGPPLLATLALGSHVRPANGAVKAGALQRLGHAKAGHMRLARGDQHVARMQRAVEHAGVGGRVERVGHVRDQPDRIAGRGGPVLADSGVERFASHVRHGKIRNRFFDAGGDRRRHARVAQVQRHQLPELRGETLGLFGRQVEGEGFHGHQAFLVRIVRTEHGSEHACPDLVQDLEPSKRSWRSERGSWRQFRTLIRG